jgi:hypothetical protein
MEGYFVALPKFTRKPILSLGYLVIKHHGLIYFGLSYWKRYYSCPKLLNTLTVPLIGYPINTLGSITYLLKLRGVLHNPTKTYKEGNTLFGVFSKDHGLNCFGLDYQRGIVHA